MQRALKQSRAAVGKESMLRRFMMLPPSYVKLFAEKAPANLRSIDFGMLARMAGPFH